MLRITPAVKHLVILNVIIFLGTYFMGNEDLFFRLLALFYPLSSYFEPWQIISHMFMHGSFQHLLFNMFALWMFGTAVEHYFGQKKFIVFYISCGLGAVALTFLVYYIQIYPLITELEGRGFTFEFIKETSRLNIQQLQDKILDQNTFSSIFDLNVKSNSSMVGASGAIMGILVAFGMMNPNAELMMIFLPIPIKAKYFIPGIIALDLFSAISGVSIFSPSNTAYIAHIGGALTGFLLMYFWKKNQFDKYRWN